MFSRHLFYGATNAKYLFIVGMVSVLVLVYSYLMVRGRVAVVIRHRWLLLLSVCLLAVYYLAAFAGIYPERSFSSDIVRSTGVIFLTYILFLALCSGELVHEQGWAWIRRTIAFLAAFISFFTILGVQGLGLEGRIGTLNLSIPGVTLANEVYAGAFLFLAFTLTLIELVRTTSRAWKYTLGVSALVQALSPVLLNPILWMGTVSLGTVAIDPLRLLGTARASSATLVLALVYLLGYYLLRFIPSERFRSYLRAVWIAGVLLGIAVAVSLLFTPGSFVQERYIEVSGPARIIVWEGAWQAIQERPVLGYGPENFRLAYQKYFDNRLYEDINFGEPWFDRAHNNLLDTLISVGALGLTLHLLVGFYFMVVVVRAARRGLISWIEVHLWGVLMVGHGLQLQTFFEIGITYALMALVLGYGLYLEKRMLPQHISPLSPGAVSIAGVVLGVLAITGFWQFFVVEWKRQDALYQVFVTSDHTQQMAYLESSLSRQSDFETLRYGLGSLTRGFFAELQGKEVEGVQQGLLETVEQMQLYKKHLRAYVEAVPFDYRARMNYAYLLLVLTTLGEDNRAEAKAIIDGSYELSPRNPLTYALAGTVELYSGNLQGARAKINEAVALNPEAPFSQEISAYLTRQEKNFPNIGILRLENL